MNLSVLMSVYHKEKVEYFNSAMQSIWYEQSVKPDEIVLVQDGPLTDELYEAIDQVKKKLGDIFKTIPLKQNVGLAKALNIGLDNCSCDFIARMDTDDISMPDRFKKQLDFMKNNNIDMCGSNAMLIDNNNNIIGGKNVLGNVTFDSLLKRCDVIHPSIIFKRDFFDKFGKYNPKFIKSQDYELWLRATKNGAKVKNLNDKLLKFRISDDLIIRRKNEQRYNMMIKRQYIQGFKYFVKIIPNILIIILPAFILDILLKLRSGR